MKPPSPPYVGPAAHDSGPGNKPITRIVIHSTVSPCEKGGARKIAAYFRNPQAGGSAHYVVDPGETVQVVYDDVIAWHAPPNAHSLGIEMCDMPRTLPGRWLDKNHRAMLDRVARLTAELCLAYDVPVAHMTTDSVRAGRKGICSHAQVSQAFGQSSHWDPGQFPWRRFMRKVRAHVTQMSRTAPVKAR